MSHLSNLYKNGLEALSKGHFHHFENSLTQLSDVREKRIVNHLKVKKLMSEGQYELALKELNQTQENYGEHISLISDQACLYYALEDYWHWDASVTHLERVFSTIQDQLEEESRFKTGLLLCKFFEEQGLIQKSIQHLKSLKKNISPHSLSLQARITANLTRLLATHNFSEELMSSYKDLKYLLESHLEFKVDMEMIYALILSEARFFSSTQNNSTWKTSYKKYLLENNNILQEEKSQILFDLLQLKLDGVNIDLSDFESEIHYLTPHNEYERKLLAICRKEFHNVSDWLLWSSQMPLGNFLMLASLIKNQLAEAERQTLEKQVSMLVYSFDLEDKQFWISKFINSESNNFSIKIDDTEFLILIDEKTSLNSIDLSTKKSLFRLIQAVIADSQKTLSAEDLTYKLFACEMDESYFNRLREQIRRINNEFKAKNLPPLLIIKNAKVHLNSAYRQTEET